MPFAVIETGGKQYRVSPGSVVTVEKLQAAEGDTFTFDRVLMYQTDADAVVGAPYVAGISVTAQVLTQKKGEKIRVFTYKSKKRQSRTLGHRQQLTQVKITEISAVAPKKVATKKNETA